LRDVDGRHRRVRARLRRARFAVTPLHARPTQVRRALGRTLLGNELKTLRRRLATRHAPVRGPLPSQRRIRRGGRNVLLISHCDFTGNSAYHVYAIACELERRGWSPAIAVPGNPRGVRDLGLPRFPVASFRDVRRGGLTFADGRGPDLVHGFTPREPVRRLTLDLVRQHACPYVVHLEDNELAVQRSVVSGYDAAAASSFLDRAAGVTTVIDRLLELKPHHVPGVVVWPGYDEAVDRPHRLRETSRRDIGIESDTFTVMYTGNVHETNVAHVRSLYRAVDNLRSGGRNVVLVKSGWNSVSRSRLPRPRGAIIDLGWIKRTRLLELLRAADALVQPGGPGPFNDYRFPSKVPDCLALGIPVVLPAANIGLELTCDAAVILERGDEPEIGSAIDRLMGDREGASRVGSAGRVFARERLTWSQAGAAVEQLYFALKTRD
jgi:glycosyltransferase involved in cell wall biosynthesis